MDVREKISALAHDSKSRLEQGKKRRKWEDARKAALDIAEGIWNAGSADAWAKLVIDFVRALREVDAASRVPDQIFYQPRICRTPHARLDELCRQELARESTIENEVRRIAAELILMAAQGRNGSLHKGLCDAYGSEYGISIAVEGLLEAAWYLSADLQSQSSASAVVENKTIACQQLLASADDPAQLLSTEQRDTVFLHWKVVENLTPAEIRDRWNKGNPESFIGTGESGRGLVKSATRRMIKKLDCAPNVPGYKQ